MTPEQLRIVPATADVTDRLKSRRDFVSSPGATPEVGDRNGERVVQNIAVTGNCDVFDLSKEEDRVKYAELSAKLFSGTEYIKLWEEKTMQGSALIVYVSYINYMNVYQTASNVINLNGN